MLKLLKRRRKKRDLVMVKTKPICRHKLIGKPLRVGDNLYFTPEPYTSRWILKIPFDIGVLEYWVRTSRPSMAEVEPIPYMATTTWQHWNDLHVDFIDRYPIGVVGNEHMLSEWFHSTTVGITGRGQYGTYFKKDMMLTKIDPAGVEIESWTLNGCIATSINYHNEMDIEPSVSMGFSFDRATLYI